MKVNKTSALSITQKLTTLLVSSRPISWVNTAFPFGAGFLVTGGEVDPVFYLALFYFLIPYNALVYVVNDVFDYESDLRNPRKGGIEGALTPPILHRFLLIATAVLNVPFLLLLLLHGTATTNTVLLLVVAGALAYSVPVLRFKERPIVDSITSSFHFVGPLLFALTITGWKNEYIPYVMAFFFWGMASHAFGAVQDINADKEAKIHSIATAFGASTTVRISFGLYLASSMLLLFQGGPVIAVGLTELLYILMVAPYIYLKNSQAEQANHGWKNFLKLNQFFGFVITIVILLGVWV